MLRYAAAGVAAWDELRGGEWTLREIAEHVAEVRYYAGLVDNGNPVTISATFALSPGQTITSP